MAISPPSGRSSVSLFVAEMAMIVGTLYGAMGISNHITAWTRGQAFYNWERSMIDKDKPLRPQAGMQMMLNGKAFG
jgi:hypothetical protein